MSHIFCLQNSNDMPVVTTAKVYIILNEYKKLTLLCSKKAFIRESYACSNHSNTSINYKPKANSKPIDFKTNATKENGWNLEESKPTLAKARLRF